MRMRKENGYPFCDLFFLKKSGTVAKKSKV